MTREGSAPPEALETSGLEGASTLPEVRQFRLTVIEGPSAGTTFASASDRASIGSQEGNDLVLADKAVSRFHCEIVVAKRRARVRDLASKNGTVVDGVHVVDAYLRANSVLRLGATTVRFELGSEVNRIALSDRTRFGAMVGRSVAMRAVFGRLERAAASDATVLLEGETGTGKGEAAQAIHDESRRAAGPFVVVDCSAIPENLLESELFGHERGAFTGATQRRIGAFEEASGGTVFLDEIGEMPPNLQPKLLRVLETRTVRRVGGSSAQKADVRILAATNRDLRAEVNAGRFRADLYYRLAVVRVTLPALRQRPEDLPDLTSAILDRLGADAEQRALLDTRAVAAQLARAAWPGNVRELRNYLERCLVFQEPLAPGDDPAEDELAAPRPSGAPAPFAGAGLPLTAAREQAIAAFERQYLADLMTAHGGRVTSAAAAAGIGRVYLHKLLARHRIR